MHARALTAVGKRIDAAEALRRARSLVEEQAATVTDANLRASFLAVDVNHAILESALD